MKAIATIIVILLTALFIILSSSIFNNEETLLPTVQETLTDNTIHLKLGHNTPVDSALHEASVKFANEVKRKTKGEVIIDIFPAQQLGNDHQMVEMARNGDIDIILTPTAKMSVAVPSVQYADLPFYFPSREDVYAMLDGEPGEMILHNLKSIGLIGVTFWENGFKHFTANEPLLSPKDFQDKKFRVMKSRIIMEQFRAFGAEPVAIDFYSTKQALHDKVVDGQENPLVAIVSMGFYKEQSDLTLSEHAYLGYVLSFSEKTFSKLPQNIQMTLIETAKEITPWERDETHKREEKLLETIKHSGVQIHTISEKDRQEFAKRTAYIPQKYEAVIGSNIISKTKELLYNKYGANFKNDDHILIGIDTDISSDTKVAGLAIKRGAEIAVSEINAKGGVLGKPLEIIVKDHRALASKGIQNIEEFSHNKHLVAIIGGVHGAVISAELDTIEQLKIPFFIPWAATAGLVNNGYKDNYIFRVSANDNIAANFIAGYTLKKYKKPAIIVENSVWGRNNLKLMTQYCQEHNIKNITEIVFNRGQNNFKKEISQILDSQADALIMVANPFEASKILQELKARKKSLPVISHWGITSGNFFKENENLLKGLNLNVFQTFSFNNQLNTKAKHLLDSYKNKYLLSKKSPVQASVGIAQAYDIVYLLKLAIEKAGTTDKTKVKQALENLPKYEGAVKTYAPAFTEANHDALDGRDYYMAKYNSNGILVPVKNK
ncbi:DctP family TRAP transporter solute-binding subunit [Sulfurimonas sp. C5]|uniref:DctP family TRAP transporter solute-binding subunit n=1 Tax=Sulfurimonas sp. C5 TaxID=3036947 RepID=UPI0024589874|nr:DctP family TRAP transporter solute-binding subunit [Sulfurimonas sp. C5]MDH4945032.1 DctP family TRAP transporter solute-binding subunit [Sulfurimonas sp. C5]